MQGYNDNSITGHLFVLSLLSLSNIELAGATGCIQLLDSKLCPSFNNFYISTSASSVFPFMNYISSVKDFDMGLQEYIKQDYVRTKYIDVMHCENIDLVNTTELYARFTTTVLCSAIVAESRGTCSSGEPPVVCAETCGEFAQSEYSILFTPQLCNGTYNNRADLLRSDFTICSNPSGSLDPNLCVEGLANERNNCGYGTNLVQLCEFCNSPSNASSICCSNSDLSTCKHINLPVSPTIPASLLPTPGSVAPMASSTIHGDTGLSPARIAVAFALIFAIFRRRLNVTGNAFNQNYPPSSRRQKMKQNIPPSQLYATPPGGVARLSALRQPDDDEEEFALRSTQPPLPSKQEQMRTREISGPEGSISTSSMTPTSISKSLKPPLRANEKRSSGSSGLVPMTVLTSSSPNSGPPVSQHPSYTETISNSEGDMAESMNEYSDHYSSKIITPGSFAAALWTYEPKMADEMALERGDLVKIVAVWNDGWATGIKTSRKIWHQDVVDREVRESASTMHSATPLLHGEEETFVSEIKAFPLVCVCHKSAWSEIIAQIDTTSPDSVSKKSSNTRLGLRRSFSGRSRKAGKSGVRFDSPSPTTKDSSSSPQQSNSSGIIYQAFPMAPPRRSNSPSPHGSSVRRSKLDDHGL
ncbi:hypothetical protein NEOLI_000627 [Neolecta irregularis DAH-3]|uniref:SH3 domain-containing protein n=1 Tax=Neolecta irregularis (strain DAH-3) TaxID=1198029 RepID=A0A1U7LUC9_NEOID|nr:hypothetical protein NEOLI_000627 [Neolecta irregularis DAH-3]|eukprot:OLL26121.1 hypothetical protein NEOLI_000627 [Neolecta irregularis DAH-3]